jgi:2,4-dienoyl-CoA reductase-like NADH-dependent reductase (Old Yellow Enzyme family)
MPTLFEPANAGDLRLPNRMLNVPDRGTFYGAGAKGYIDYPRL